MMGLKREAKSKEEVDGLRLCVLHKELLSLGSVFSMRLKSVDE